MEIEHLFCIYFIHFLCTMSESPRHTLFVSRDKKLLEMFNGVEVIRVESYKKASIPLEKRTEKLSSKDRV